MVVVFTEDFETVDGADVGRLVVLPEVEIGDLASLCFFELFAGAALVDVLAVDAVGVFAGERDVLLTLAVVASLLDFARADDGVRDFAGARAVVDFWLLGFGDKDLPSLFPINDAGLLPV